MKSRALFPSLSGFFVSQSVICFSSVVVVTLSAERVKKPRFVTALGGTCRRRRHRRVFNVYHCYCSQISVFLPKSQYKKTLTAKVCHLSAVWLRMLLSMLDPGFYLSLINESRTKTTPRNPSKNNLYAHFGSWKCDRKTRVCDRKVDSHLHTPAWFCMWRFVPQQLDAGRSQLPSADWAERTKRITDFVFLTQRVKEICSVAVDSG